MLFALAMLPTRVAFARHPPPAGEGYPPSRPRRSAPGFAERRRQRMGKRRLLLRAQEAGDRQPPAVRHQEQPLDAEFLVHHAVEPHPERVERPFADAPVIGHLAHGQFRRRHRDLLVGARIAVVQLERPIDQQHLEPAEAEHRPGAAQEEIEAGREARAAEDQHEDEKTAPAERPVRRDDRRKDRGFAVAVMTVAVVTHGRQYRGIMARKKPRTAASGRQARRKAAGDARKPPRWTRQRLRQAHAGKAAKVKGSAKRAKADRKAATGSTPPWTNAEIEEAFRRFQADKPAPRGELEHINPFTLLVAVVLSAQATDAGVNKATPALFAAAD